MSANIVTRSQLTRAFVRFKVTAFEGVNVVINPTTFTVQAAFPVEGVLPVTADWKAASWETGNGPSYYMRCLVGPGGGAVTLVAGRYDAYTSINTGTELVIEKAGLLIIY